VVVVDDDDLILRNLKRILEGAGFDVRTYAVPEEAIARIEIDRPTVIVSDYMMPGTDGISLLQQIRIKFPTAVRVLCTAAEEFRVALNAVNSGEVYRIISKPWHNQDVVATIVQAADVARLRTENDRLTIQSSEQNERLRELNSRLEEKVRERTEALLGGLISALDYRDAETQWHSRRVSFYARRLAVEIGVVEPELTTIEHGALLHDIGKIGIRDRVLLKPGPLDASEWREMKRHPELGWELLRQVEYLRSASVIVLQHQEKWNGTGYPAGLNGEDILLGARIFHIVDALDAITSDRPYRKARTFEEARAEIARCRGVQFDPKVVDAFLQIPNEEWRRISIDVEQFAILTSEMAERRPGAGVLPPGAQA